MKGKVKLDRALFVGDLHCGSHYGLWPISELPPSRKHRAVRYLMECWQRLVDEADSLDLLVLMGDLIDGAQRKSQGTGLFSANLGDQVEGAIEVLRPLAKKAKRIIRVEGTPYHEDFHRALASLDHELGVAHAAQVIDLALPNGEAINIAHHPSGGSALYMGTKTDREGLWSIIAAATGKVHPTRFVVRAHVHEYLELRSGHRVVVTTPCWQLPTPHAKKGNYYRWQPTIGGLYMLRDESEPGGYRFRLREFATPLPEVTPLESLKQAA